MNNLLPVLALALAAVPIFASARESGAERPSWARIIAALALTAVAAVAAVRLAKPAETSAAVIGLGLGLVATTAAACIRSSRAAWAIGVAASTAVPLLAGPQPSTAHFALVSAALLGAIVGGAGTMAAVAAAVTSAATYLATARMDHAAAPTIAGIVALAAAAGLAIPAKSPLVARALPGLGAVLAAGFLSIRTTSEPAILLTTALGVVAAAIVLFVVPEDAPADGLRTGIAALVWLGVATVAFGLLRGLGMALALMGALAVLLPSNAGRAKLTLGPLVGLVLYRLLREAQPDVSRALDIGQHYALVGLMLGLIVPLLPSEIAEDDRTPFLWGLLALGLPALVILVFGGVGAVGFIAGLGLSGTAQALRGRPDDRLFPLAIGMSGLTLLMTGWTGTLTGLTRDEKLRVLGFAAVAVVIIAAALAALVRLPKTEAAR